MSKNSVYYRTKYGYFPSNVRITAISDPFQDSDQEDGFNLGKYFALGYERRMNVIAILAIFGTLLFATSFFLVTALNKDISTKCTVFAIVNTLSIIVWLLGTLFVAGPVKQIKNMCTNFTLCGSALTYLVSTVIMWTSVFTKVTDIYVYLIFCLLQMGVYWRYLYVSVPPVQSTCCV